MISVLSEKSNRLCQCGMQGIKTST